VNKASIVPLALLLSACPPPLAEQPASPAAPTAPTPTTADAPTLAQAEAFLARVEPELLELWIAHERAMWIQATYITDDTDLMVARANEALMEYVATQASQAQRFAALDLPAEMTRKLNLLKLSLDLPAPSDPAKRAELAAIASRMKSLYGKGKYCREGGECMSLGDMSRTIATSRDPAELQELWLGWRRVSPPMRQDFARFVELANEGARELGFTDLGALWRSRYDMPPAAFEQELERLWGQVKPLYEQLHCYVRARLRARYGEAVVAPGDPIPAHLLGNMWSQDWLNVADLVVPDETAALDITALLRAKKMDPKAMVKQAEGFFTSLGMAPLPESFWQRSMFVKPADRDVVCHASAWDVDWKDDLRIKMCIEVTGEDFTTIHHELGHNYYQRAYKAQPPLFTNSANDGFHEALGDTIALSVTPAYLKQIGLIDEEPPANVAPLLLRALDKISFLPFGLVVDKWRFDVFSGAVTPERYNGHWWQLRQRYQGIVAPAPRSEADFDPGAKYHVPANVPYTRYFLASILQFQFHRALCQVAGQEGPLHTCSIYGNKEVGARLDAMMQLGLARPWTEALRALSGEEQMDASAMVEYFKPLSDWLSEQNQGEQCGW